MIPQEKIEQAAKLNVYKHFEESEAFKDGFYKGTRFAEAEMKQDAQEFAEWHEKNGYIFYERMFKDGVQGVWFNMKDNDEGYTTPELYAKFDDERGRE